MNGRKSGSTGGDDSDRKHLTGGEVEDFGDRIRTVPFAGPLHLRAPVQFAGPSLDHPHIECTPRSGRITAKRKLKKDYNWFGPHESKMTRVNSGFAFSASLRPGNYVI